MQSDTSPSQPISICLTHSPKKILMGGLHTITSLHAVFTHDPPLCIVLQRCKNKKDVLMHKYNSAFSVCSVTHATYRVCFINCFPLDTIVIGFYEDRKHRNLHIKESVLRGCIAVSVCVRALKVRLILRTCWLHSETER